MNPVDTAALKARVPLVTLVSRRVELRQRRPGEWVGRCPFHQDKTPSFKVDGRGFFRCFGCDARGDHFSWLEQAEGLAFREAVTVLEEIAGGAAPRLAPGTRPAIEAAPAGGADEAKRQALALRIWQEAAPAAGTPVETYLAARGIRLAPPPTLRWHPRLYHPEGGHLPAMVAAMTNAQRRIVAIHRTFLKADGSGKAAVSPAKMMLGPVAGTAIRLAPLDPGGTLGLAEGIETALTVMQESPGLAVWAAGSLGAIAGAGLSGQQGPPHPTKPGVRLPVDTPDLDRPGVILPPAVRHVVILADADGDRPSQSALIERAIRRWQREGRRVTAVWPRAGRDFNDMLGGA